MDIMRITVEKRKCTENMVNKILIILMIVISRINVPIVVETILSIEELVRVGD